MTHIRRTIVPRVRGAVTRVSAFVVGASATFASSVGALVNVLTSSAAKPIAYIPRSTLTDGVHHPQCIDLPLGTECLLMARRVGDKSSTQHGLCSTEGGNTGLARVNGFAHTPIATVSKLTLAIIIPISVDTASMCSVTTVHIAVALVDFQASSSEGVLPEAVGRTDALESTNGVHTAVLLTRPTATPVRTLIDVLTVQAVPIGARHAATLKILSIEGGGALSKGVAQVNTFLSSKLTDIRERY
jgi:hypothetical protein